MFDWYFARNVLFSMEMTIITLCCLYCSLWNNMYKMPIYKFPFKLRIRSELL